MKKVLIISTVGLMYDGITSILTSYLKAMDRSDLEIHLVGTIKIESAIRIEMEQIGCHVADFPSRRTETAKYITKLIRYIRKNNIQIVHAHGNSATLAIEMMAAWLGGCKKRIAHSHNTCCNQIKADKLLRPFFYMLYTDALACGEDAGRWLFGSRPFIVLKNGRELENFVFKQNIRNAMRAKYGLNEEIVIGHVGGFFEQKNHAFLISVFREILRIHQNAKLFLVGDGPLKLQIENSVKDIKESIVFVGTTTHVENYLQLMDGMLLPSLFEGLPLVAIEWQINGLPCIFSDIVTKECAMTSLVHFLQLDQGARIWAKMILELIKASKRETDSLCAKQIISKAGFDIKNSCVILRNIYCK